MNSTAGRSLPPNPSSRASRKSTQTQSTLSGQTRRQTASKTLQSSTSQSSNTSQSDISQSDTSKQPKSRKSSTRKPVTKSTQSTDGKKRHGNRQPVRRKQLANNRRRMLGGRVTALRSRMVINLPRANLLQASPTVQRQVVRGQDLVAQQQHRMHQPDNPCVHQERAAKDVAWQLALAHVHFHCAMIYKRIFERSTPTGVYQWHPNHH